MADPEAAPDERGLAERSLVPVVWPFLVLGIALLLFVLGASEGIYRTSVRVFSIIAGAAYLVGWLVIAIWRPAWRPQSGLLGALAAALLALGASALGAPIPRLAVDYLAYATMLTALYLLLVRIWGSPEMAQRLGSLCLLLVVGVGVLYLGAIVARWIGIWSELGRFVTPPLRPGYEGLWFGNPNALAPVLVLLYVTAIAQVGMGTQRQRGALAALGALVLVDVVLTGSRGAWLGLATAALTVAVALVLRRDGRTWLSDAVRRLLTERRLRVVGGGCVMVALLGGVALAPSLLSRLGEQAAETRTVFWAASWRMLAENPVSGIGPGAWAPFRPGYTVAPELDYYIPHAHNLPLHVASELGLIGVLAAAVVAALVLRLLVHALRSPESATRRAGWVALFAVAFVLGQHMVDEYVHQPAVLFAIALPIAKLDSVTLPTGVPRWPSARLSAVLLIAVVAMALVGLRIEVAASRLDRATSAADGGAWAVAATEAAAAVADDPDLAPYRLAYGAALAQTGDLTAAATQLEAAVALDDYPQSWLLLAAVRARVGDTDAALAAAERAMRLGEQQPAIAVGAAQLYADLGHPEAAADALAAAFVAAPSLASDPFWTAGPWTTIREQALDKAYILAVPAVEAAIALEAGDTRQAMVAAEATPGRYGDALDLSARALAGDPAAFDGLHAMAIAQPLDKVVGLCVRTADQLRALPGGDASVLCDRAGMSGSYPIIRVDHPPYGQSIPGPDGPFHPIYAYRRFAPFDVIAPWLPHIVAVRPAE